MKSWTPRKQTIPRPMAWFIWLRFSDFLLYCANFFSTCYTACSSSDFFVRYTLWIRHSIAVQIKKMLNRYLTFKSMFFKHEGHDSWAFHVHLSKRVIDNLCYSVRLKTRINTYQKLSDFNEIYEQIYFNCVYLCCDIFSEYSKALQKLGLHCSE